MTLLLAALSEDAVAAIVGALGGATVGALIAATLGSRQLTRQLEHDRDLSDLAELRAALDEAAGIAAEAERRTRRVYILVTDEGMEDVGGETEEEQIESAIHYLRTWLGDQRQAQTEFLEGPPAVLQMLQRLFLRFEPGDDLIPDAYRAVYVALGDFLEALPDDPMAPQPREIDALDAAREGVSDAVADFLRVGRERIRVAAPS